MEEKKFVAAKNKKKSRRKGYRKWGGSRHNRKGTLLGVQLLLIKNCGNDPLRGEGIHKETVIRGGSISANESKRAKTQRLRFEKIKERRKEVGWETIELSHRVGSLY